MSENLKETSEHPRRRYWLFARKWWKGRGRFSQGPVSRGFELWRSHPRWYMHSALVEDCAMKGGCCGRDCGCCVDRVVGPTRKLGVGHCTVECGCYRTDRGFELAPDEKKMFKDQFGFARGGDSYSTHEQRDPYYSRIYLASIWGLLPNGKGNLNPFDSIVGEDGNEQTHFSLGSDMESSFTLFAKGEDVSEGSVAAEH